MTAAEQTRFYMEYHSRVLGYIISRVSNREDAEDICQDVFEKAFHSSDSYNAGKSAIGTWLYAITRNTVIDFRRKSHPMEELPDELSDNALPEDEILQTELLDKLADALDRLPADLTDIIVLHYYDRLTLTEVAEKTGLSYGSVKMRHNKALTLLRTELC